jgi:hypothetical protein
VQTLTANKADVNIRNDDGLTPLEMLNKAEKMIDEIIKQYIGTYKNLKNTIEEEDKSSIRELLKPKSQICLIL